MEAQTKQVNGLYVGKKLEEVATALTAAGYKIRVVPAGVPVRISEQHDIGRATIEVVDGLVTYVKIG
jgi:hypothetical protein